MICSNCGEETESHFDHIIFRGTMNSRFSCPSKAERSEALQGCPPSATGSAGARASDEAGADSSGRSADGSDPAATEQYEPMEAKLRLKALDALSELTLYYDCKKDRRRNITEKAWLMILQETKPPALTAQRERASQPNAALTDPAAKTKETL